MKKREMSIKTEISLKTHVTYHTLQIAGNNRLLRRLAGKFPNTGEEPVIIGRKHKTEPEIGMIQKRKGGAAAYHHTAADRQVKQAVCGLVFL